MLELAINDLNKVIALKPELAEARRIRDLVQREKDWLAVPPPKVIQS